MQKKVDSISCAKLHLEPMKLRIWSNGVPEVQEPAHEQDMPKDAIKDLLGHDAKHFTATAKLSQGAEVKAAEVKDAEGNVIDWRDVTFDGYLSTFKGTTESDRDGDYVEQGAFKETIGRFMSNPVMLIDHVQSVRNIAGSFISIKEDSKGLRVTGKVSNSPEMRHVRFLVKEGHLNTMSMGGVFHYNEDGRGIFKVDLWEGSLVAVPANPDAIITTRGLDEKELTKAASRFKALQATS